MHLNSEQLAVDENTPSDKLRILASESVEIARLVAANLRAEPKLLEELAVLEDAETRKNVILNPNTPRDILIKLAEEFPDYFFQNSVLELLLLEKPLLPLEIPFWTLLKLLKQDYIPIWFLSAAASHTNTEILEIVATNPHTPETALLEIAVKSKHNDSLGLCIAHRKDLSEKVLRKLIENSTTLVRLYLAAYPKTPSPILEKILEFPEKNWNSRIEIQKAIARNCNTSIGLLEKLLEKAHAKVKRVISLRSNLPKYLIVQLALDYRVHAMRFLAQNSSIPSQLLVELAGHSELKVRQMVVSHPNTPVGVIIQAVKNPDLRLFIAENSSTPVDVLQELAEDSRGDIQKAIAQNPTTPGFILSELARNPLHDILVARHPNTPEETRERVLWRLAFNEQLSVRKFVAQHNHAPPQILVQWARNSPEVRPWVAKNPNTPVHILEELALNPSIQVRINVAKNPNSSNTILERLAKDWYSEVRQAVASNSLTSPKILAELVKDWHLRLFLAKNPGTPASALEHLAQFPSCDRFVLEHPNTPLQLRQRLLTDYAKSADSSERLLAAKHPDTPFEVLEILVNDKEPDISKLAIRNLDKRWNSSV
ncbi:MAG: hypothetical protein AAF208_02495 [Cyanobacteria bacterium P01_A01_bin.45]